MDNPIGTADPLIEAGAGDHLAAMSPATQHRPIVLVMGMHRSGTSLCSHILSALGVDMADDIGDDPILSPMEFNRTVAKLSARSAAPRAAAADNSATKPAARRAGSRKSAAPAA